MERNENSYEVECRTTGDPSVKGESFLYASRNLRHSYRAKSKTYNLESKWCESVNEALDDLSDLVSQTKKD